MMKIGRAASKVRRSDILSSRVSIRSAVSLPGVEWFDWLESGNKHKRNPQFKFAHRAQAPGCNDRARIQIPRGQTEGALAAIPEHAHREVVRFPQNEQSLAEPQVRIHDHRVYIAAPKTEPAPCVDVDPSGSGAFP